MMDAHRVVGRDGAVQEGPGRSARVLCPQASEGAPLAPLRQDVELLGWEIGQAGDGARMGCLEGMPGKDSRSHLRVRRDASADGRGIIPPDAASAPVTRAGTDQPFAAAFLSLLFPASVRPTSASTAVALAFAAPMIMIVALGGGLLINPGTRLGLAG